ncbi:MAG: 7-cyano-7-deazaguanine reductase [Bacteroidetes bacterium RIFCSPHIGHO2_02_FULL_44_7]|nr:MAG: 7-cyano-7-deazaguanine reductase [Bacteroidetes bacterium RIFCSPHIGHO2_02_FULL_44_7]
MDTKPERKWSDASLLKTIPNPSKQGYEIKIKSPEVTFLGVKNQPDFATIYLTLFPADTVIELRSLKFYFQQFRNIVISYERFINVVYEDLISVYKPNRLRIVITFSPRGGISSSLIIDSDWKIRGGEEKFKDWVGRKDEW